MSLTKATSPVIEDDLQVKTINGAELSVFSKPNAIPISNAAGTIDSSWGVGGGGGGGSGDMDRNTYDSNSDGIVNAADVASKIAGTSTANKVWGTDSLNVQKWMTYTEGDMKKSVYDTNGNGVVDLAEKANEISGSPGANKIYGTDALGNKGFLDVSAGFMRTSTYDTNGDGKVNAADAADRIAGSPAPDQIFGTDGAGNQIWKPENNFLLASTYDSNGDGKVDKAEVADEIFGNPGADKIYGTNGLGVKGWYTNTGGSGSGGGGDMFTAIYDPDQDGSVRKADEAAKATVADRLTSADIASNKTFYGKNSAGVIGFYTVASVNPELMTTSEWTTTVDGDTYITNALTAFDLDGTESRNGVIYLKDATGNVGWRGWTSFLNGAKVKNSSNVNIPTGTATKINWSNIDMDPFGIVSLSNSRITIPAANEDTQISTILRANITVHVAWAANATGERNVFIRINGIDVFSVSSQSGTNRVCHLSIPYHKVTAGDYIEVYATQTSGAALAILPESFCCVEFV